jgi:group II intron reverse transcriptase/maturase
METKLNLIAEKARKEGKYRFWTLMHLINAASLRSSFYMLRQDKACGIDGVTMQGYEEELEQNIKGLLGRMKQWSYKPQPVKRVYIPKANGKLRPLGIPAVEDKMVQMCVVRILNAIYEQDFIETSYGFRPNRSCHDALNKLDKVVMSKPVNHIIDADIKGFFDNVDHEWMMKFLEVRIADRNLLRLIKRYLIGGYIEEGRKYKTEKGTPQGGVISPLLANVYLHYVLDVWIERVVKKHCVGYVELIRYCDDFVICVQKQEEAQKLRKCLEKRLNKFGLELSEEKTRVIGFGRYALQNAKRKGKRAETFNFLGFTHFIDKSRKGNFKVGRRTEGKKLTLKLKELNNWLKKVRNLASVKEWWPILCSKLRGHFQYYGVSGNFAGINRFFKQAIRLVFKWINRRSQKKSFNWKTFLEYLRKVGIPKPEIHHNLYTLYGF